MAATNHNESDDISIYDECDYTGARLVKTSDGKYRAIPGSITGVSKIDVKITNSASPKSSNKK